jgi:hypothetical protein
LDGYANEGDWGNWTSFVYGKWTDQFNERSPLTGNYTSQDGTSYNTLKKEVYYLDAAYTRTHAVLFPKSSRSDANGAIIGGSSAGTSLKLNSGLLFTADGIKKIRALINSTVSTLYDDITTIKGYGSGTVLEANDLQSIPSYSPLIPRPPIIQIRESSP